MHDFFEQCQTVFLDVVFVLIFLKTMYDNTIIIIKFGFCDIQNNDGLGTSVISLGLLLGW